MIFVGLHFGSLELPGFYLVERSGRPVTHADGDDRRPGDPGLVRAHPERRRGPPGRPRARPAASWPGRSNGARSPASSPTATSPAAASRSPFFGAPGADPGRARPARRRVAACRPSWPASGGPTPGRYRGRLERIDVPGRRHAARAGHGVPDRRGRPPSSALIANAPDQWWAIFFPIWPDRGGRVPGADRARDPSRSPASGGDAAGPTSTSTRLASRRHGRHRRDPGRVAAPTDLDVIAITDHERIDAALAGRALAVAPRPARVEVVVGEEITTRGGHLLGLWLTEPIRPWQSLRSSIAAGPRAGRPGDPGPSPLPVPAVRPGRRCSAGCWPTRPALPPRRASRRSTRRRSAGRAPPRGALRRRSTAWPPSATAMPTPSRRSARGWTTFPGRRRDELRARDRGRRDASWQGTFHPTAGQLGHVRPAAPQVRPRRPRRDSRPGPQATAPAATTAIPAAGQRPPRLRDRRTRREDGPGPADEDRPRHARTSTRCRAASTQHVRYLYENLRLRGHDVRIISSSHGLQRASEGDVIRARQGLQHARPTARSARSPSRRATSARSAEMLERERFDLLHFHEPFVPFLSLDPAAPVAQREHRHVPRLRRLLAVVRVRAAGSCRATRRGSTAGSRSARPPATSSTATSRATTRSSPTASTWPASNGPCPLARWQDGTPNLLFVGRHEPRKGLLELLKALPDPAPRRGRRAGSCRRLGTPGARGAPLRPDPRLLDVEFLGRVSDAEKAQLFKTADVFVSPATGRESFGIVLLEAMAAGAPIVCSDIHGYKGVVRRGAKALLVEPHEPKELAGGDRPAAGRPGPARVDERGRPAAGRGVQLGTGDGQGRGLLRLRDPPTGRQRAACRPTSTPRSPVPCPGSAEIAEALEAFAAVPATDGRTPGRGFAVRRARRRGIRADQAL